MPNIIIKTTSKFRKQYIILFIILSLTLPDLPIISILTTNDISAKHSIPKLKSHQSDNVNVEIFYISPKGSDENVGTKDFPFATLERANIAINELKGKSIVIYLREGYYPLGKTFVLNEDKVSKNSTILISSFPGEQAHIIGGIEIKGFEQINQRSEAFKIIKPEFRENIFVIDLKTIGITEYGELSARGFGRQIQPSGLELYFNEKPMTLARWPNDSWTTIDVVPDKLDGRGFKYTGNRSSRWINAQDLWLHGYWKFDWADSYVKVAEIDTLTKTIITEFPYSASYPFSKGKRFYAFNLLEELDSPGEWYLNRETGKLYFWPPSDLQSSKIFLSLMDETLIKLIGATNVRFKNLTFEYTRGAGIEIIGGSNNIIESCTLRNIGTVAVSLGKLEPDIGSLIYKNTLYNGNAGHKNGVQNCEIYSIGEGGIILGGGDRITLTSGDNFAINNHIYDCSRWVRTYRAGIFIYGVGNIVKNNLIHDLPHTALFFWGNDHLMEYNEIHNVCMETGDAGAFYNGRDWTQRGSTIRFNYFHNLHGVEGQQGWNDVMAIYLDDWSSGARVFGNIFYRAGRTVMIGGGRDNLVENNIIIDGSPALHVDARGLGWANYYFDGSNNTLFDRLKAVQPNKHPYSTRYPELTYILKDDPILPKGNKIIRNISIGGKWIELLNDITDSLIYFEDNSIDIDRRIIIDRNNKIDINYESELLPNKFKPIPLDKIGRIKKQNN